MNDSIVKQAMVTSQRSIDPTVAVESLALFNADGSQVALDSLQVQTGADVVLTGYEVALAPASVSDTDTVNEAIGKLEATATMLAEDVAIDDVLTGYVIDGTGGAIADTDTILEAIAKLEKRTYDLENP